MSENNHSSRAMQAIDALLADKPSEFRATVFELSRQLGWADDEPGFLLAIATNQLEALVKQYPERISEAMETAARELEDDWRILQGKLTVSALKSADTAHKIDVRLNDARMLIDGELSQVERVLARERAAMAQAMTEERAAMQQLLADERAAMAQRSLELTDQQQTVIEARTTEMIARAVTANQERADKQVKAIVKGVLPKHYTEVAIYAICFAAALICIAWGMAWGARGLADNNSVWGDIERWNQDELQACQKVSMPTCSFHIEVPKPKA